MGTSASKAARSAGGATARKYPTRKPNARPPPTPSSSQPFEPAARHPTSSKNDPSARQRMQASGTKSEAIANDARDPDFDARLRQVGPVQPNPTFSPSSTSQTQPSRSSSSSPGLQGGGGQSVYPSPSSNPAIAILAARQRIQEEAERERLQTGQPGFEGKTLLDVKSLRRVLTMRDEQGIQPQEIERMLNLKPGTVDRLGRPGAVESA